MKQKKYRHNFIQLCTRFTLVGFCFLFFSSHINAEVRLNEIYPAPKSGSGEMEWIELYNNENKVIELTNYSLTDEAKTQIKITATSIEPYGFIIVETSSVLNNGGDTIYLKNNSVEIEQVSYTGTFDEKKSFTRCMDGGDSWFISTTQTKQISNKDVCTTLLTPTPTNAPTMTPTPPTPSQLTPTPTPTTIPISHNNIFISEVMPNPEDNNSEWIELYNNNDFEVLLNNWYIDDGKDTGSSPKLFTITIPSHQYVVIELTSSLFNNDGDTVRLLDFNKIEKDSFLYTSTTKGITYGRISFASNEFCEQDPTKGSSNKSCKETEPDKTPTPTPSRTPTHTPTNTLSPTQPLITPTPLLLTQLPIIVDSHRTDNDAISSNIQSLPSQGSVLSAKTKENKTNAKAYVIGLSSSSALISLMNIGNIIRKIIQRVKFNSD